MATLADLLGSVDTSNMSAAGVPRQAAPAYQKPRGFVNTVGRIADVLAALGGDTPYADAISAKETAYTDSVAKTRFGNLFRDFVTNPGDVNAQGALAQENPEAYLAATKIMFPQRRAGGQGSVSDKQFRFKELVDAGVEPREALAQVFTEVEKPAAPGMVLRSTPGGGTAVINPDRSVQQIIPGRAPAASGGGAPPKPKADVGTPAQQGKAAAVAAARQRLGRILTQLDGAYTTLEQQGGISGESRTALANIGASTAASGVGQMAGRALGTKSQTQRDRIAGMRGAIVSELKTVTGKTSGELNSIPELDLALRQATDPAMGIETNRAAIKFIYDTYLDGAPPATPTKSGFSIRKLP